MKITDEMIEAAARTMFRQVSPTHSWAAQGGYEKYPWREDARAVLEAALAVAPEKGDLSEIIAEVLEAPEAFMGIHYEGCWKYHAGCLAMLLRKAGVVAPPKNEGRSSDH